MPALLFVFAVSILMGCASKAAVPSQEPAPECRVGEFVGVGAGETENAALAEAHSALARQINSSVKVTAERTVSQQLSNGKEDLSSGYKSWALVESSLPNAHDARVAGTRKNGDKINVTVCMSKSDAAKGFAEQLRPLADSLKFAASGVIDAKHPKLKSEAWQKTKPLWDKFVALRSFVENLDKEKSAPFEPIAALYAKASEGYLDFCQTAKLYWNPEQNDVYSEIAFSKLSKNLKLEKAACNGQGISLVYKNTGHKCEYVGMFECVHKPSLLIASCSGEVYRLLESKNVEVYQKVEDVALEKLREKLADETFWNEWEQEIKQWIPVCD